MHRCRYAQSYPNHNNSYDKGRLLESSTTQEMRDTLRYRADWNTALLSITSKRKRGAHRASAASSSRVPVSDDSSSDSHDSVEPLPVRSTYLSGAVLDPTKLCPVDYGPPAIEPRFETIHLSSDDPESEEFEDMTVYGYTLKVSKGKVRRARQLEIIDLLRRDPKCLEFVASYQQLLMERNYYMMDQNSDQFEENYEVMQDDKEVSDLYDCMFSCS